MKTLWLCGLLAALVGSELFARDFNVLDFGAKGDGTTLDTAAIQRAIDAAAATTNGRVVVPRGKKFLIGSLTLRGGINFYVNGELLISTNPADYASDGVLVAHQAPNLTISGHGKISGRSLEFMTSYDAANEWWLFKEWRPTMFKLVSCTNLTVRDITFRDAPFWGLHMLGCENVLVDNIKVENRLDVPNCDGIDPDHCRNVVIRNCRLVCGDDAIVIKSTRQTNDFGVSANIHVYDCEIVTQDSGLKIGTETTGDIRDVVFERCKIISSCRGLTIQLRDEGSVSNIVFRDIELVARYHSDPWWGRGEAISFTAHPRTPETKLGRLSNVLVQNVTARAENSIRINGSADRRIENVCLENVSLRLARWTKYPGGVYDNRPIKVLEPIEPHPTDAFNLRHAEGVVLRNCSVKWAADVPDYFRNAVTVENAVDTRIEGFMGESIKRPIHFR